ncbi:sensor domain-containing protein [Francisella adeliensis]|uniref:EAL domain-containing protein n=1 Tax=Francisella adeliensis TaxID=2007306 RepID=A0A2Z4XYC3_9GAMM|nr:EAL domain-containing protein [Francisella adeliensis]AXA33789.1 hypothetical protein CDH04_04885 [Francisella adeliensis]MBK2085688.1 EAL domain-containing protein [Francisella adeliensis]MBK2097566.1 EAL domain-containing protein [Francisella adeliensis]QIW12024.1 EAL domain-containing protein [Francisella adeliensis]QIW13899.1 EAL domain-containing protein [Francisella adeliensis]
MIVTHYLKKELEELIKKDSQIFEFFRISSLDGLWYWDLENPENEWIDSQFWKLLGYDPKNKKHLVSEWQDIIFPEDLETAVSNFEKHLKNPNHPYDQVVRYMHKNGSTIWVRCRGVAIRDEYGKAIRMLGAHNNLTQLKNSELNLQNTNDLLGLILDNTPDLIYVKDSKGNIIKSNKSFEIFHKKNKSFSKFISEDTYNKSLSKYSDSKAFANGIFQETFTVSHDNKNVVFEILKIKFNDRINGALLLCIAKDITDQKILIDKLKAKNTNINNLLNASESNLIFVDTNYEITQYSKKAEQTLNMHLDITKSIFEYIDFLNISNIKTIFKSTLKKGKIFEKIVFAKDLRYYQVKIRPYINDDKQITSLSINIIDVNDLEISKHIIKENETLIDVATKHARIGIWVWYLADNCVHWNDGMFDLFGLDKKAFIPTYNYVVTRMVKDDQEKVHKAVKDTIEKKIPFNVVYRVIKQNGELAYIHGIGQYDESKDGLSDSIAGMSFDITAQKEAENQLKEIAYKDTLTGVSNRTRFITELDIALKLASDNSSFLAILFIDLDNFKQINDIYGHIVGDKLLVEVSNKISKILNDKAILARVGGDEFAAIITDCHHENEIAQLADKCIKTVIEPYSINNEIIAQSISIGISTFPQSSLDANELLKFADTAMYNSKEKGKNTYSFYRPEHSIKRLRSGEIENALKLALEKEEFTVVYQPQYDSNASFYGVEALLRWDSELLGAVTPDEFIPIAEKSHKIVSIGWWVLQQVIKDIKHIEKSINSKIDFKLSVNISSVQLFKEKFTKDILDLFKQNNINNKLVNLEITETHLLEDIYRARAILNEINKTGTNFALDDFGTGYSSLTYLANLPINYLKIDKSFVQKLDVTKNKAIVKSIVQLSQNLNKVCIAEGVETLEQFEYLKKIGCNLFQGYYFNKPLPINEIVKTISIAKKISETNYE